jgi:hypothetical protein
VRRGVRTVSWFIYRFTSPAMQQLFMQPRREFGMQQAVISMLAGNMFGRSRPRLPLALVKGAYYVTSAMAFSRARASHQQRRRNASLDVTLGTNSGGTRSGDDARS